MSTRSRTRNATDHEVLCRVCRITLLQTSSHETCSDICSPECNAALSRIASLKDTNGASNEEVPLPSTDGSAGTNGDWCEGLLRQCGGRCFVSCSTSSHAAVLCAGEVLHSGSWISGWWPLSDFPDTWQKGFAGALPRASPHPSEWLALLSKSLDDVLTQTQSAAALHEPLDFRCGVAEHLAARRSAVWTSSAYEERALILPWSFAEHSCCPNTSIVWSPEKGSASPCGRICRPVAYREVLSVSRLRRPELRMCTELRREILASSLGLPQLCHCARCTSLDTSRGIRCVGHSCNGVRYPPLGREGSASSSKQCSPASDPDCRISTHWVCDVCGDKWSDAQMPLEKENSLCEGTFRLWMFLDRDVVRGSGKPLRDTFQSFRDLCSDVASYLGDHHWCSLLLAECAVMFFLSFGTAGSRFARDTVMVAHQQACNWLTRWFTIATMQRFVGWCPGECADFITYVCRNVEGTPTVSAVRRRFLQAAEMLWSGQGADAVRMMGAFADGSPTTPSANASATELLEAWELYLSNRVAASIQSDAARDRLMQRVAASK